METNRFCNGIVGTEGEYLPAPASLKELASAILKEPPGELGSDYENNADLNLVDDLDAEDLASTGWGVIFAEGTSPAVREALAPLLNLRKEQATKSFEEGYREFHGSLAYRKGQSQEDFLNQWQINTNGLVDPSLMPYYLLLVGGPAEIDFEFQYEMDVAHAVGRIHFDTLDEYAQYAEAVVAADTRACLRRVGVFGVQNGCDEATRDPATRLLLDRLVLPVVDKLERKHPEWIFERVLEQEASKARLEEILRDPPSLLFTASHGLAMPKGHARQITDQGAIVCRDWPGMAEWRRLLPPDFYYTGADVSSGLDLSGRIVFQFGCFSAGTPGEDDYKTLELPWIPAERPFLSSLPKRLLSLPGGRGALAFVGHVDRIWSCSFFNEETNSAENLVFEQFLRRLLAGRRIGHAVEYFNHWHANYAVRLTNLLFKQRKGEAVDAERIARTWLINNDARNYILLGDPAVRLRVEGGGGR